MFKIYCMQSWEQTAKYETTSYSTPFISHYINVLTIIIINIIIITYRVAHPTSRFSAAVSAMNDGY